MFSNMQAEQNGGQWSILCHARPHETASDVKERLESSVTQEG
jgi:hypothetical protein